MAFAPIHQQIDPLRTYRQEQLPRALPRPADVVRIVLQERFDHVEFAQKRGARDPNAPAPEVLQKRRLFHMWSEMPEDRRNRASGHEISLGVHEAFLAILQLGGQYPPQVEHAIPGMRGGGAPQVLHLLCVFGKMEELFGPVAAVPDVFLLAVGEPMHGAAEAGERVFTVEPGAQGAIGLSEGVSEKALAIDSLRGRQAGAVEQRGQKIAHFHHGIADRAARHRRFLRRLDDQRHAGGAFIGITFSEKMVVAQHFAVVGGENDPGVRVQTIFLEQFHEAADLVVDVGEVSVISGAGALEDIGAVSRAVGFGIGAVVIARKDLRPIADWRRRQVGLEVLL